MKLGYGIVAYRNMLWVLICAFSIFSILAIPSILIYKNGQGYSVGLASVTGNQGYSLGALGYSSM